LCGKNKADAEEEVAAGVQISSGRSEKGGIRDTGMTRHGYVYIALVLLCSVSVSRCTTPRPVRPLAGPEPVATESAVDVEDRAVREVLDEVERAMEQRDVYKVLVHVSASYHDKVGRDYTDLGRFLRRTFGAYGSIEIARSGTEVTIDEDRAAVTETYVTFARGKPGTGVEPLTVRGRISVFLEKIAGRWLIVEWGETT